MKWWVARATEALMGATQHYLMVQRGPLCFLQDVVTGQRWFVCCDRSSRKKLLIIELPKLYPMGSTSLERQTTVVPLSVSSRKKHFQLSLCSYNENHLLLCFGNRLFSSSYCEFLLVDLMQTTRTKTLAVLSLTVPLCAGLCLPNLDPILWGDHCVLSNPRTGGSRSIIVMSEGADFAISIEEATGKIQPIQSHMIGVGDDDSRSLSLLSQSQLCIITEKGEDSYEVWDVNDAARPIRTPGFREGCTAAQAFVEGGLLFQMSESLTEMHVTEESSGAPVIAFKLLERLKEVTEHFSFHP
ncbi:hypothetical protein Pelo_15717 [Pelomyxa schiedti]|nr:hypothetical protein Pelo_15717 [Pelomyxa schiedti]